MLKDDGKVHTLCHYGMPNTARHRLLKTPGRNFAETASYALPGQMWYGRG